MDALLRGGSGSEQLDKLGHVCRERVVVAILIPRDKGAPALGPEELRQAPQRRVGHCEQDSDCDSDSIFPTESHR